MAHLCEKCRKSFRYPSELERHKQRKTPCVYIPPEEVSLKNKNICTKCSKVFLTARTLQKHVNLVCTKKEQATPLEDFARYSVVNNTIDNSTDNSTVNNIDIKVVVNQSRNWRLKYDEPNPKYDFPKISITLEMIKALYQTLSGDELQQLYRGSKGIALRVYRLLLSLIYERGDNINIVLNMGKQDQVCILSLNQWIMNVLSSTVERITPAVINELNIQKAFLPRCVPPEFVKNLTTQMVSITDAEFKKEMTSQLFNIEQTVRGCSYEHILKNLTNADTFKSCAYDELSYAKISVIQFITRIKQRLLIRNEPDLLAAIDSGNGSVMLSVGLKILMQFMLDDLENVTFIPMGDSGFIHAAGWRRVSLKEGLSLQLPPLLRILLLILDSGDAMFYNRLGAHLRDTFEAQLAFEIQLEETAMVYTDFIYDHLKTMRGTPSFPKEAIEYYDSQR